MDIAIIGAGAIGGYYGARLAQAGNNVHFLYHTEYDHVREHGLKIESCFGDFVLEHPFVYQNVADMPKCDLVCVAVKATANETMFPLIGQVLKEDGNILLLQNGFGSEQRLAELYPDSHIFGGMCFICAFRVGAGYVRHTSYGKITLAALDKEDTNRLLAIQKMFEDANIETAAMDDLIEARWRKLVWNIPYNGMSVTMNCLTDRLANDPPLRSAVRAVMEEILAAGKAAGINIEAEFVDAMITSTDAMPAYEPSMKLDYLASRPLETEAIYGNAIRYAASYGYDMKYAKMIKWQLESISNRS